MRFPEEKGEPASGKQQAGPGGYLNKPSERSQTFAPSHPIHPPLWLTGLYQVLTKLY